MEPIQIRTPRYDGIAAFEEFARDIRALLGKKTGPPERGDLYCEFNESAHFRVRIGNSAGEGGFTLDTVKRFAVLVLCFEKEFDKMLADHMGYISENVSEVNTSHYGHRSVVLIHPSYGQAPSVRIMPLKT